MVRSGPRAKGRVHAILQVRASKEHTRDGGKHVGTVANPAVGGGEVRRPQGRLLGHSTKQCTRRLDWSRVDQASPGQEGHDPCEG